MPLQVIEVLGGVVLRLLQLNLVFGLGLFDLERATTVR